MVTTTSERRIRRRMRAGTLTPPRPLTAPGDRRRAREGHAARDGHAPRHSHAPGAVDIPADRAVRVAVAALAEHPGASIECVEVDAVVVRVDSDLTVLGWLAPAR